MTHDQNENQPKDRPTQDASTNAEKQESEAEKTNSSRIASPAQVAANRRNAQKSTGPKTSEGKARSRWNAVQHGLLARRLFARDKSDSDDFDHLLESLREDWQPDGTLEEILLEKIAIGYFRLHVVYGYEAQYARSSSDFFATIDRTGRYATSINRQLTQDVNQFERLQRQRKGEFVPAPISVDVNVSGLDERVVDSQFVEPYDIAPDRPPSSNPVAAAELASVESTTPQLTVGHVQVEGESLETISEAAEEASRTSEVPTSPQMQDE